VFFECERRHFLAASTGDQIPLGDPAFRTLLRGVDLAGGALKVDSQRPAFRDDLLAADIYGAHGAIGRRVNQAPDWVAAWLHQVMLHVNDREIGLGADCQSSNIFAALRSRAPNSGGIEDVGGRGRSGMPGHQSGHIAHMPHLLDHVMRIGIGTDAYVDACLQISSDMT